MASEPVYTIVHRGLGETLTGVDAPTYEADYRDAGWHIAECTGTTDGTTAGDDGHTITIEPPADFVLPVDLEALTVAELRAHASAAGLTGMSSATKAELIAALTPAGE